MNTTETKQEQMEKIARTILALTNTIPTPTTKLCIRNAGVDLARLVLGED